MSEEEIELKYRVYILNGLSVSLEDAIDYEVLSFDEFKKECKRGDEFVPSLRQETK